MSRIFLPRIGLLIECHFVGSFIKRTFSIDVYTHQTWTVWILFQLFSDSHKIICEIGLEVLSEYFLFVWGTVVEIVIWFRWSDCISSSQKILREFRSENLQLWAWPVDVLIGILTVIKRSAFCQESLVGLRVASWFKVSLSHIYRHILYLVLIFTRQVTALINIGISRLYIKIIHSLCKLASPYPNYLTLSIFHWVISLILRKVKVTHALIEIEPTL